MTISRRYRHGRMSRSGVVMGLLGLVLLLPLALTQVVTGSAGAAVADGTYLQVSFGGNFNQGNAYTSATGETMTGSFVRRSGTESLDPSRGLVLGGGRQGMSFTPTGVSLGGSTIDQGLVLETTFTPTGAQSGQATLLSAGGGLWARFESGQLRYGFDASSGGTWSRHAQGVAAPSAGSEHTFSMAYLPKTTGASVVAYLDGKQLPTVDASVRAALLATSAPIGIGNEVHGSGLDRGFAGSLRAAHVATASGAFDPAMFKLQKLQPTSTEYLSVTYAGSFDGSNTYAQTGAEVRNGRYQRRTGGEDIGTGGLNLAGGTEGTSFAPEGLSLGGATIDQGLVLESTFTLAGAQAGQATLLAAGSGLWARFQDGQLRYGFDALNGGTWTRQVQGVTAPAAGSKHTFSMAYLPEQGGATVVAYLDGRQLPTVTANVRAANNTGLAASIGIGNDVHPEALNRGINGTLSAARFATASGVFSPSMFRLQQPVPCAADPVAPAPSYPVQPGECAASVLAKASGVRPTPRQVSWQESEQTAFLHFGMNTFTGNEWGNGQESPNTFQPSGLNTDQWARSLRDNGFRYAILTVKHHDGFLLYPSRYTDHDVASSSWQGGRGDVVKAFTESAHRYGLKVGLYLSPSDWNQYRKGVFANGSAKTTRTIPTLVSGDDRAGKDLPSYTYQATDYGAYFLNQLYETLTQYGQVDEVWFDGADGGIPGASAEQYDYTAWYDLIRKLQPQATIAVSGPDVRWVGNESGLARENESSVIAVGDSANGSPYSVPGYAAADMGSDGALTNAVNQGASRLTWWPAEVDVSIRQGWFYHADQQPKSVDQLRNIYYQSVGRNSVLLLNIPPDTSGALPSADVARMGEWNGRLRQDMPGDLALGAAVTGTKADGSTESTGAVTDGDLRTAWIGAKTGQVTVELGGTKAIDRVTLGEDIADGGQQVTGFVVEGRRADGTWARLASSGSIGYRKSVTFGSTSVSAIRVQVTSARGPVHFAGISAYQSTTSQVTRPNTYYVDCSAAKAGPGTSQDRPMRSLGQLHSVNLPASAQVLLKAGTTCADPVELWGYGLDGAPAILGTYGSGSAPVLSHSGSAAALNTLRAQGWQINLVAR